MSTTVTDLRKIYTSTKTDADLQVYLDTAILVVTEELTGVSGCSMSQDRLDKITLYLAAHFADVSTFGESGQAGPLKSSKTGEATEVYVSTPAEYTGYMLTRWGQTAMSLDTCGILIGNTTNKGLKAQIRVV